MPAFHELKISDVRRETEDCVSIAFEVPEALREDYRFIAGQNLTLRTHLGGADLRRSYSICVSPSDGELRVAVKKVPGGQFSTFANEGLKPGDTLEVMTPTGNFRFHPDPARPKFYLAFAAGSGITPIMSILKTVLEQEPESQFTLFYGNRATESIIFREQIEALKNRYLGRLSVFHVLSREHPGSALFSGRITADKCEAFLGRLVDVEDIDEVFVCGPEPMIEAVRDTLTAHGVDRRKIHFELFTTMLSSRAPARPKAEGPAVHASIAIRLDGNTFEFPLDSDGDTILEAALKAGADLPYSCKGGVCSTCRARLLEGQVDMDLNWALEPEELEAGYILTCQSHPKTGRVVVDFDA